MKTLYVIDGNAYIYRSFYAIPPLNNSKGLPTNAVYGFLKILIKIITEKLGPDDKICVCFDAARKTFRNEIYPEYKATRDKMPDDLVKQVPFIKESLKKLGIKTFEKEGFEADDLIATIAEISKADKVKIISSDKDILQMVDKKIDVLPLPKEHLVDEKYFKQEFGFEPKNMVDFLSIMGDSSDNVPGVRGLGKVAASELIKQYQSVENILANLDNLKPSYRDKIKENLANLKMSKELITLKTDVPFDFDENDCVFAGFLSEFKMFLEEMEFFSIAKSLYDVQEKKDIKFTEKSIFDEKNYEDFTQITAIFSDDLYFKNKTDILYKINLDDFYFYRAQIVDLFKNVKSITTDNAKNLYAFFLKNEIDYAHIKIFDVLLAEYLQDTSIQSLDLLMQKFNGNKKDVFYELHFLEHFEIKNLTPDYFTIDLPFCEALASMEKNGVKLDLEQLARFNTEIDGKVNVLVRDIYEKAGEVFNINSPKQLANILFLKLKFVAAKKTKTGFSTSEEVLQELAKTSDFPGKILEYRELVKLKTTYVEPLMRLVDFNKRIHTTYNFTKTTTGRLSSTNPNLQNIPIKTDLASGVRKAFIADDGYVLVSADYSQIDLVVLAHMSGDENISKAFIKGEDIHSWTASLIFKKDIREVTQKERSMAKQINFGLVYGKGSFALSEDLGISMREAKNFIELYFETFPRLKKYFDEIIKDAREKGYVSTILGRKRFIKELFDRNMNIQKQGERLVKNTPIQGSSADILKKAMVDLYKEFGESQDVKMLLQIHDEILFEIKKEIVLAVLPTIKEIMENTIKLNVPLRVNINYGKNWAELK